MYHDNESTRRTSKFDKLAIDIEFMLISVIQGIALAALASDAIEPITKARFEYWPYIASSLILVLFFWSQSVIHALSFISWPLDLPHNFLYFLATFAEVMVFGQVASPTNWFAYNIFFFAVAFVLYGYDFVIIQRARPRFVTEKQKKLYFDIWIEQKRGLTIMVPFAVVFNVIALELVVRYHTIFVAQHYHVLIGLSQMISGLAVLWYFGKRFKTRANLLAQSAMP